MGHGLLVQYGCGFSAPSTWLNFDASPTLRFERIPIIGRLYARNTIRFPANVRYGDIVKGLPINDKCCKLVYCSHVLEHLALEDFRAALANTLRLMESGGVFRLVVPDLEFLARQYLDDSGPDSAIKFMQSTGLGRQSRSRGLFGLLQRHIGNSSHLWMWDFKSIEKELRETGFRRIRRAEYDDSEWPQFRDVEEHHRWRSALGIECVRE